MLSNTAPQATTFEITDAKLYVTGVAFETQYNARLLKHLKSGFKRAIIWSKYLSKVRIQAPNQYSDYLIGPSSQGVNRLFALSFEFNADRTIHTKYYFPTVEEKDYNAMINATFLIKHKKILNAR